MVPREGRTSGFFSANVGSLGRTSEGGFSLRFFFFTVGGLESKWGTMPAASWVFSSSSIRKCVNVELGTRDEGSLAADGRRAIFLRLRGGPMRTAALPVATFEEGDERDTLSEPSASTRSSSSYIVSLLIRCELPMGFMRAFLEADEDVRSIFCFLDTGLGSSSAGVSLMFRRFRFPREGSPDTGELLSDVREITGESVMRLPDITEVRELLVIPSAGLAGVDAAVARAFFDLLGADAIVSVCP